MFFFMSYGSKLDVTSPIDLDRDIVLCTVRYNIFIRISHESSNRLF